MSPFLKHPQEVGMTYCEHCCFALTVAAKMTTAGLACIIHAFLPFCFEKKASRTVKSLHETFKHHYDGYLDGGGI